MSYLKINGSGKLLASDGIVLTSDMVIVNPFAVYSADDRSLTFYSGPEPKTGSKYRGKTATTIYEIDRSEIYEQSTRPWASDISTFRSISFDESYQSIKHLSMSYWFYNASNCTSIDVSHLNGELIKDTSYMFQNCSGLTQITMGKFNAPALENLNNMFYNCPALEEIDVSRLNTSLVKNMSYMFYGCTNLKTIYSDDDVFVTSAVTSGNYMFRNCNNLVGGNGTAFSDVGIEDYSMAHIDQPDNPGYFMAKGD